MTTPHQPPVAVAQRVGQATTIEQSRAVAEVYAAVMIAQQNPRNVQASIRAMEQACRTQELADAAFYNVPRGDKIATDISIHLARELARCWGNMQAAVTELALDEDHGQSEMQAVAWDLEANNRVALTFIQPHRRAGKGAQRLIDTQAIYETNANAGARRLRQCILSVLPRWFTERARRICQQTLNDGGGAPLPERIAEALKLFEDFNIAQGDIERVFKKNTDRWTPVDLGKLRVTYQSLKEGMIKPDEAFPPARVTPEKIAAGRPAPAEPAGNEGDRPGEPNAPQALAEDPPAPAETERPTEQSAEEPVEMASTALHGKIKDQLRAANVTRPREQAAILATLLGHPVTWSDLTADEGLKVVEQLVRIGHSDNPANALDQLLGELKGQEGDSE